MKSIELSVIKLRYARSSVVSLYFLSQEADTNSGHAQSSIWLLHGPVKGVPVATAFLST